MHFDTKKLTRCALIAAIYVALTMLSNALNLAYGPIQLRFSEAMTVLPFLMPEASWGLFIGCVLSNVLSPYGPLDMIVGSAATLLAALLTARCLLLAANARTHLTGQQAAGVAQLLPAGQPRLVIGQHQHGAVAPLHQPHGLTLHHRAPLAGQRPQRQRAPARLGFP